MKPNEQEKQKKIAKERIAILLEKAATSDKSKRYIELARKIAMKLNIKLTKQQKRLFCKHCYTFLRNGVNATTRTHNKKLIIFCKECKKYTRIPLFKKPSKE